jgi:hypothetical protein
VTPRRKSALLWGAVGALAFLVLAQGYVLVVGRLPVGMLGRLAIGVAVGAVVAGVTYATEHRIARKEQS